MRISEIFKKEPSQWGLRGDPFLWRELKQSFKETEMPGSVEQLHALLLAEYEKASGYPLTHKQIFVVGRFKHGGMSSGGICPEFWQDKGIPLLLSRY